MRSDHILRSRGPRLPPQSMVEGARPEQLVRALVELPSTSAPSVPHQTKPTHHGNTEHGHTPALQTIQLSVTLRMFSKDMLRCLLCGGFGRGICALTSLRQQQHTQPPHQIAPWDSPQAWPGLAAVFSPILGVLGHAMLPGWFMPA